MRMSNKSVKRAIREYLKEDISVHLDGTGAVANLEKKLKNYYGMRYALAVSSGTSGLMGIALALELRETSFITTPYTYGASIAAWMLLQNRPIFCDIDPETLTLDPVSVRRAIDKKTQAILVADIYGTPADSVSFRNLANQHGLWYIADAAQGLGAYRNGQPSGRFADAIVLSFTVGKTVAVGEGGAVLTNNTELYQKLLWHTQHPRRQRRELGLALDNEFGINARIHPLAAAWADVCFESALSKLKKHQQRCFKIIDHLNATSLTETIRFSEIGIAPTFNRLTAAWKGSPQPKQLVHRLCKQGVSVEVMPAPVRLLYQQPAFLSQYEGAFKVMPCPHAERQARQRFCLLETGQRSYPQITTKVPVRQKKMAQTGSEIDSIPSLLTLSGLSR